MNLDIRCTTCGVSINTTTQQRKFCDDCYKARVKIQRKARDRAKQEARNKLRPKMPTKPKKVRDGECRTCELEIGCRAQLRQNLDPYCWDGPDTNNKYYYLYEAAKAKSGTHSR